MLKYTEYRFKGASMRKHLLSAVVAGLLFTSLACEPLSSEGEKLFHQAQQLGVEGSRHQA